MQLDVKALGVEIGALIADTVAPLLKRIEELEARQPEKGEKGDPGQDAPPVEVDVAEVVKELLATDGVKHIVGMEVAAYMADNPPPAGRDGKDGERGPQGEKGADGSDGAGIADLLIDREGALVVTMTDGRMKSLGQIVGKDGAAGKDGRDGVDGLGFEDCEVEIDPEGAGTVTLKYKRGDLVKSVSYSAPTFRHIGFWGKGMTAQASEFTTHDGSLWMAKCATDTAPSYDNPHWQLAARKGADGQRGKDGKDYRPSEPVKLRGSDA